MKKTTRISPTDPITSLTSSGYESWYCYITPHAYGPSLFCFKMIVWLDVFLSCILYSSFPDIVIDSFESCAVEDVCVPQPAEKQCEWDRSVRQTGIIYAIKFSPASLCSLACCFHTERGSEWRAMASVGQQMFSSLKETGLDWETGFWCPTEWRIWCPGREPTICWTDCRVVLLYTSVIGHCVERFCKGLIQEQVLCCLSW